MADLGPDLPAPSQDAQQLLNLLPADGTGIGNQGLRTELGWDEERYFAARDELLDRGLAERWRGRGGSLRCVLRVVADAEEAPAEPEAELEFENEADLYPPIRQALMDTWALDNRLTPCVTAIIGFQGRRRTGGKWSRPDLVLVSARRFRFVPGVRFDVVTFEVKQGSALDVTAVYEALAHRRAATRCFVLATSQDLDGETQELVASEAARHGVGLIIADNPADANTWETIIDAESTETDPDNLESFLATQLPQDQQDEFLAMLGELVPIVQ